VLPVLVTIAFYSLAVFSMLRLFYSAVAFSTQLSESASQETARRSLFLVHNQNMDVP